MGSSYYSNFILVGYLIGFSNRFIFVKKAECIPFKSFDKILFRIYIITVKDLIIFQGDFFLCKNKYAQKMIYHKQIILLVDTTDT